MKKTVFVCAMVGLLFAASLSASAANLSHTVVKGDTMWKIASRYQIGISEVIRANPQISDPDLIYPGQVLAIPREDSGALTFENEVIRLVNEQRAKNGLKPLSANWELSRVARYKSRDMAENRYFSHTTVPPTAHRSR